MSRWFAPFLYAWLLPSKALSRKLHARFGSNMYTFSKLSSMKPSLPSRPLAVAVLLLWSMCCLHAGNLFAQFKMDIHNEDDYKRVKGKFPDASFVDLSRQTTITIEKPRKDSDEPFVWQSEQKFERLSSSNERTIPFGFFVHDFIEVENAMFWARNGRNITAWRVPPTIVPVESNGVFHANYRVHSYGMRIQNPGAIMRGTLNYKILTVPHGSIHYFAQGFPAEQVTLVFKLPASLKVRFEKFNFENSDIEEKKEVNGKEVIYTFTMHDVPAQSDEDYTPGPQHYLPFLVVVPEEMEDPKTKRQIRLFAEPADVYAWNKKLADRTNNQPAKLQTLVTELTAGKSEEQKLEAIYYWVQKNIRYLAYEDGWAAFVPDACQDVYAKRYGDCKGMANLLKQMLLLAGFDARLVWIGTREHSPLSKKVPVISSSNHMIAAVRFNDEWLFIDGTTNYQPLWEVPDLLQGQEVFIEGKDRRDYELYTIPNQPAQQNAVTNRFDFWVNVAEGSLEGKQHQMMHGTPRSIFRSFYHRTALKDQEKLVEKYMSAGQSFKGFSNLNYRIDSNYASPLEFEANVLFQGQATVLEKEVYLPTSIYNQVKNIQLPEKRDAAVSFDYERYYSDSINYVVPTGYEIGFLPEAVTIVRDKYRFHATVLSLKGGTEVQVVYTFELSDFIIKKAEFDQWNLDIKKMKAFLTDQIILQKKKG